MFIKFFNSIWNLLFYLFNRIGVEQSVLGYLTANTIYQLFELIGISPCINYNTEFELQLTFVHIDV